MVVRLAVAEIAVVLVVVEVIVAVAVVVVVAVVSNNSSSSKVRGRSLNPGSTQVRTLGLDQTGGRPNMVQPRLT